MIALERLPGVGPELISLLKAVGVASIDALAAGDAEKLSVEMSSLARKRGKASLAPSLVSVKLWIRTATDICARQGAGGSGQRPDGKPVMLSKVLSIDDIPEAIITDPDPPPPAAPVAAPPPAETPSSPAEPEPSHEGPPRAPHGAPEVPPHVFSSENLRHSPAERALESMNTLPPPAQGKGVFNWDSKKELEEAPDMDKTRFQSFNDYSARTRGIEPLERTASIITDSPTPVKARADGTLSRRTRRGVACPHPGRAIFGALIAIAWRIALAGSIVGLPWFTIVNWNQSQAQTEPILLWAGGLLLLGLLNLWMSSRLRCRVCSCPVFHSRRCAKNKKAHHIPGLGYVFSLSLHLLLFFWFRCMYCGTALRLMAGRARPHQAGHDYAEE